MLSILVTILALVLFCKFVGFTLRLTWGLCKVLGVILMIVLAPVALVLLPVIGVVAVGIIVAMVCGAAWIIGGLLTGAALL